MNIKIILILSFALTIQCITNQREYCYKLLGRSEADGFGDCTDIAVMKWASDSESSESKTEQVNTVSFPTDAALILCLKNLEARRKCEAKSQYIPVFGFWTD